MTHSSLRVPSGVWRSKAANYGLLFVSAMAIALLASCSRGGAEAPTGPPVMGVKVQAVESHPIGDASEYVATIKSRHSATIMSDVEGLDLRPFTSIPVS